MTRHFGTIDELRRTVGETLGPGSWFRIEQPLVNGFADLTADHEWLHVDVERARNSAFGGTIAHGYLTLSLIPLLGASVYSFEMPGQLVNYGLGRVRFPATMPVGAQARSRITPLAVTPAGAGHRIALRHEIEVDGQERPACVADTIFMLLDDDTEQLTSAK